MGTHGDLFETALFCRIEGREETVLLEAFLTIGRVIAQKRPKKAHSRKTRLGKPNDD